jgi:hypothetical protein
VLLLEKLAEPPPGIRVWISQGRTKVGNGPACSETTMWGGHLYLPRAKLAGKIAEILLPKA